LNVALSTILVLKERRFCKQTNKIKV